MHAPQIILIVLWTISLTGGIFLHGKTYKFSFPSRLGYGIIEMALLYWGGFFG